MVNFCCHCGRVTHGLIPKDMDESELEYYSGTCGKCNNETYEKDYMDLMSEQAEQTSKFVKDRINRYGS